MTVDKIIERTVYAKSIFEIEETIEKTILEVHRNHIRFYPNVPRPYFSLIAAIRDETGNLILLTTNGTSINKVYEHQICVGTGQILGNYLIRTLSNSPLTLNETSALAAYVLHEVKKNTRDCGQSSEILLVPKRGSVQYLDPLKIMTMEGSSTAVHGDGTAISILLV